MHAVLQKEAEGERDVTELFTSMLKSPSLALQV